MRILYAVLGILLLLLAFVFVPAPGTAWSQSAGDVFPQPIAIAPGDAAISGFSGVGLIDGTLAPGTNPLDKTVITVANPVVKVVHLSSIGGAAAGQLVAPPVKFSVAAKDIGQVFALAFDTSVAGAPPALYAASTSIYGLSIVADKPGPDGQPVRLKAGAAGARFMDGLFGPGATPGAIWKIDTTTGAATLFAETVDGSRPNAGPAIGDIAIDPKSKSLFASDLDTGLIQRFPLEGGGTARPVFDHGTAGRSAAQLPAVADDKKRADIASAAFKPADAATWGFTQPERRVDGLAVHDGRLYYAVAAGPEIWSVGISADGSFASDPRREVEINAEMPSVASDIAFDGDGRMIVALRGVVKGAPDNRQFVEPESGAVLRFAPNRGIAKAPWTTPADSYAVGTVAMRNTATGGIALGYAYNVDGTLDLGKCSATLAATGDTLPVAGGAPVNGAQVMSTGLVQPAEAPEKSAFVYFDAMQNDKSLAGHVGDIEILQPCDGSQFQAVAAGDPGAATDSGAGAAPGNFGGGSGGGGGGGAGGSGGAGATPGEAAAPEVPSETCASPAGGTPAPLSLAEQAMARAAASPHFGTANGPFHNDGTTPGCEVLPDGNKSCQWFLDVENPKSAFTGTKLAVTSSVPPKGDIRTDQFGQNPVPHTTADGSTFEITADVPKGHSNMFVSGIFPGDKPDPVLTPKTVSFGTPADPAAVDAASAPPMQEASADPAAAGNTACTAADNTQPGGGGAGGPGGENAPGDTAGGTPGDGTAQGASPNATQCDPGKGATVDEAAADGLSVKNVAEPTCTPNPDGKTQKCRFPVAFENKTGTAQPQFIRFLSEPPPQKLPGTEFPSIGSETPAQGSGIRGEGAFAIGSGTVEPGQTGAPIVFAGDYLMGDKPVGKPSVDRTPRVQAVGQTTCDPPQNGEQVCRQSLKFENASQLDNPKIEIMSNTAPKSVTISRGDQTMTPSGSRNVGATISTFDTSFPAGSKEDLVATVVLPEGAGTSFVAKTSDESLAAAEKLNQDRADAACAPADDPVAPQVAENAPDAPPAVDPAQRPPGPSDVVTPVVPLKVDPALPPPELVVTKLVQGGGTHCTVDGPCVYNIVVTNRGPGTYKGPVGIQDKITPPAGAGKPQSIRKAAASDASWQCEQPTDFSFNCGIPELTLEQGKTFSLLVEVVAGNSWKNLDTNEMENCADLSFDNKPGVSADDQRFRSCKIIKLDPFDVKVAKTGGQSCQPGKECEFDLDIFNPGNIPHDDPVTVSDKLIGIGDAPIVSLTAASGADPFPCTPPPTQAPFTCSGHMRLDVGEHNKYKVVLRIPDDAPTSGTFTNCAGVGSGADASTPGSTDDVCHTTQLEPNTPDAKCPEGWTGTYPDCTAPQLSGGPNSTQSSEQCFGGMILVSAGACRCPAPMVLNGSTGTCVEAPVAAAEPVSPGGRRTTPTPQSRRGGGGGRATEGSDPTEGTVHRTGRTVPEGYRGGRRVGPSASGGTNSGEDPRRSGDPERPPLTGGRNDAVQGPRFPGRNVISDPSSPPRRVGKTPPQPTSTTTWRDKFPQQKKFVRPPSYGAASPPKPVVRRVGKAQPPAGGAATPKPVVRRIGKAKPNNRINYGGSSNGNKPPPQQKLN